MMHGNTDNDLDVIIIDDPWTEFAGTKETQAQFSIDKNAVPSKYARWPVWAAATVLTLIVHSLVIGPFLLGSAARKHQKPMTEGGEASAQQSTAGEFVSHLILINDHGADASEEFNESPYVV